MDVQLHQVEHGTGRPVLLLHGTGVDHRELEACFEPMLASSGLRRVYPDLPGMGRSPAPDSLRSAEGVLAVLVDYADRVSQSGDYLLIGHSAGSYYAQAMAQRHPDRVAGLALICPLLSGLRDVPEHQLIAGDGTLGDDGFRGYFVIQTPAMLERYQRCVAPAAVLADQQALERIGACWALESGPAYPGPTLLVAGRQDSTVGYAATMDLLADYPAGTLAVLDRAGHALPHEQPELLGALIQDWLSRVH